MIGAKKILILACSFIFLLMPFSESRVYGQSIYGIYPFEEDFLSGTRPAGVILPTPSGYITYNSARFTSNGLQLTPDTLDRFGAVYLNDHKFQSENGILIEFEYMFYGGDGGDGLSVFFFDASVDPGIGASGAGIGYAYNRTIDQYSQYRVPGLNGAYMGVAFDSFGNFKAMRFQGESRVNGIPFGYAVSGSMGGENNKINNVTIRGARRPLPVRRNYNETGDIVNGLGLGYCGYPVLVSQYTEENMGFRLVNSTTPNYERYDQLKAKQGFSIRGGTTFNSPEDAGYRKAFIEMYPNGDDGFLVTVLIQHGNVKDTVIYDYNYRKEFDYYENALPEPDSYSRVGDDNISEIPRFTPVRRQLIATIPDELKIGFAAATGTGILGRKDKHFLKNVRVSLPRAAEAYNDSVEVYEGTAVTINPLENDIGYEGEVRRIQEGHMRHLDETTFRFVDPEGNTYTNEYEVEGVGVWRYANGVVTFSPRGRYVGVVQVEYDILGGKTTPVPYSDEAYRSLHALLYINYLENPMQPRNMITNKMVTPVLKR